MLHESAQLLGLEGSPEDLHLRAVQHGIFTFPVSFALSSATHPSRDYKIHQAFTAKELGLVSHTYPVAAPKEKYPHLSYVPIPTIDQAQPLLLSVQTEKRLAKDCSQAET